jgi:DNA polymerase-3 subunit alpha
MVALYRPGPMDNIPTYINRKHKEEPVDYLHPMLEPILRETYGVIIYQEQVMQIAQVMAGYSLGDADLLRRAMGKKDKAEMAKQQARFVEGAMRNGVGRDEAGYIFELVDKFAGYGFNKSHAAAYALVSYQTAYMKANFREEFLAASMTLDMGNTDKLAMFVAEARRSGIAVLPPSVNESEVDFLAEPPLSLSPPLNGEREKVARGAIRYSLAALKNIGATAVATVVEARKEKGPFSSLGDFAARLNTKALNKRGLETLAAAGAFDALEPSRALVHANVDSMLALATRVSDDAALGTADLFGGFAPPGAPPAAGTTRAPLDLRPAKPWTPMERLQHEFEAVGFFLSGHPLDAYEKALKKLGVRPYAEFEASIDRGAGAGRLAAIVLSARERRSQKGNKFAFAMFSDATGQFEAVIFSDTLALCRELLEPGTPVLLTVEAERDGENLKMRVQAIEALDKAAGSLEQGLGIVLDEALLAVRKAALEDLKSELRPAAGNGRKGGEVRLLLRLPDRGRTIEIALPGRYDVSPAAAGRLSTVPGVLDIVEA